MHTYLAPGRLRWSLPAHKKRLPPHPLKNSRMRSLSNHLMRCPNHRTMHPMLLPHPLELHHRSVTEKTTTHYVQARTHPRDHDNATVADPDHKESEEERQRCVWGSGATFYPRTTASGQIRNVPEAAAYVRKLFLERGVRVKVDPKKYETSYFKFRGKLGNVSVSCDLPNLGLLPGRRICGH